MSFEDLKHWIQDRVGGKPAPAVAVLRLEGVIGGRGVRGLTLQRMAQTIERAFELRNLKAVALAVNSPGGAPVQSALLYRRIRQLAAEKKIPVFAFAEDVAASGGYWLLLAGDEIYADAASIVGSIGVVTSSFGFAEVLKRLGVERRLHTSGRDKSLLDPFLAEDPREVQRLERLQRDLHDTFKSEVEERRGAKLSKTVELFEGEIFSGRRALELGLVDGLGELRGVMRERFGETVRLRTLESARSRRWWRLPGVTRAPRGGLGDLLDELVGAIEERLTWSRFGL
ncbi:MAG TPA: S49 family peptidase [Stellaceae bacterium]|nr:S49 family peptidase [Stellaceae bacterium]